MRDILAALLRSRGYIHNDGADPRDKLWFKQEVGFLPMLACLAHEINRDANYPVPGWDPYDELSIARAARESRTEETPAEPVPVDAPVGHVRATQSAEWVNADGTTTPITSSTASVPMTATIEPE